MPKYEPTIMRHPVYPLKNDRDWEQPMKDRLIELCSTSMSYGVIAATLRAEFPNQPKTRNAVLGKATRMGLRETRPAKHAEKANAKKRDRRKVDGTGRPRMLKVSNPVVLRKEDDMGAPVLGAKRLNYNDPELAIRKKGRLPCIIEETPLTSTRNAGHRDCQWPTSDGVRDMEVCGAKATIGAYCDRHAQVAYRIMPTGRRNSRFHKVSECD